MKQRLSRVWQFLYMHDAHATSFVTRKIQLPVMLDMAYYLGKVQAMNESQKQALGGRYKETMKPASTDMEKVCSDEAYHWCMRFQCMFDSALPIMFGIPLYSTPMSKSKASNEVIPSLPHL